MDIIIVIYAIILLGILSAWGTIRLIESITIDSEKEVKKDD